MHIFHLLAQATGEIANGITTDKISTVLLIAQQIQLSQMKVKVNALWDKFLGGKSEDDEAPEKE
jgi:hypothetical protein